MKTIDRQLDSEYPLSLEQAFVQDCIMPIVCKLCVHKTGEELNRDCPLCNITNRLISPVGSLIAKTKADTEREVEQGDWEENHWENIKDLIVVFGERWKDDFMCGKELISIRNYIDNLIAQTKADTEREVEEYKKMAIYLATGQIDLPLLEEDEITDALVFHKIRELIKE